MGLKERRRLVWDNLTVRGKSTYRRLRTIFDLDKDFTGVLPITKGGTSATTKEDAFSNLSPLTSKDQILYHDGVGNVALNPGIPGDVLSITGPGLVWAPPGMGNFTYAASEPRSTTTSTTFQDKVSLVTPATTGTFIVHFQAIPDAENAKLMELRLYDQTAASVLAGPYVERSEEVDQRKSVSGFVQVVLSGVAKTLVLQWKSRQVMKVAGIAQARIMLQRAV